MKSTLERRIGLMVIAAFVGIVLAVVLVGVMPGKSNISPRQSPLDSPIGKVHRFTPTPEEIRHHYTQPKENKQQEVQATNTPEPTATAIPLMPVTGGEN